VLCNEIRDLTQEAFPSVWVTGEVNRVREHRSGHCYFELIEKGSGDEIVGKLEAVAWRSVYQEICQQLEQTGQTLVEGQQIRCRGQVDFYPPFGRLQFVVRKIDPVFSLGELARRRQEILAALSASGLLELNKKLHLSRVPLRIGLVTSHESAAYHDFLGSLSESGYGFEVVFVHAAVQGRQAESEVSSAIEVFSRDRVDCVVVIRGGGSRSDLAVFDSQRIAEAIATSPVPVLTGLGHQIDQSIADLTAHTTLRTPTKAAEFLVERVAESEREMTRLRAKIAQIALERVRQGREGLGKAQRGLAVAKYRLLVARRDLEHLTRAIPLAARQALAGVDRGLSEIQRRLSAAPARTIQSGRRDLRVLARGIVASSQAHIREWSATLEGWNRLIVQLAPARILDRGFSITRDAEGRVLFDPKTVRAGDQIKTDLAGGTLTSRVETS
jgi:exodeoxyribonuclease VII large subunit